jgi:hypothetical protein
MNLTTITVIPDHQYKMKCWNYFGDEIEVRIRVIAVKKHGFNLKSGAWSLYRDENAEPAQFLLYEKYPKEKVYVINTIHIINLEEI